MVIAKNAPVGIDWYIQKLQTVLHDELVAKWNNIQSSDYVSYARCYRNKTDDGYIAEHFVAPGSNKEVYYDSAIAVSSFFGLTSNITRKGPSASVDVHLVFFADLKKIKPDIDHRADEEVRQDVASVIGPSRFDFTLESIEIGIENSLREYPGSRRDDRLKYVDMDNVHCFRINLKLIFNPNKIC
jgi:hypothetical protein